MSYVEINKNELMGLSRNFKDLMGDEQSNYILNSDGPVVKAVAIFLYV